MLKSHTHLHSLHSMLTLPVQAPSAKLLLSKDLQLQLSRRLQDCLLSPGCSWHLVGALYHSLEQVRLDSSAWPDDCTCRGQ